MPRVPTSCTRQTRGPSQERPLLQATDINRLLQDELDRIEDASLVLAIRLQLVSPRCEDREWDYGPPGQTYPCWIFLEHAPSNTGIAYCAEGFGPRNPWGLLFLGEEGRSMGMDSSWYATLEDAFRESSACDLPPRFR
jgi:hypothetical protein